jgi:hypothetical protein
MRNVIKNNVIDILLKNDNTFNNFKNITVYVKNSNNDVLNLLIIYIKGDKNKRDRVIHAERGAVNGNYINLVNGNIQEFDNKNHKNIDILFFDNYTFDLSKYYDVDISTTPSVNSLFLRELIQIKDKKQNEIAKIFNMLLTPLLSIVLSVFSAILILNQDFSRAENNKKLLKIYLLCIIDFMIFLYSMDAFERNKNGIYGATTSLILPCIYVIIECKRFSIKKCK